MSIYDYVSPIIGQLKEAHACPMPNGMSKGRDGRDWAAQPYGSMGATPEAIPRLPVKDILEAIKEKDEKGAWITERADKAGSPVKDQNGTNYCWINAVIRAMELRRVAMGLPYVSLSPASVGAIIKGYRNQGGWGGEGLAKIREIGVSPSEFWPDNAIQRSYDNAQSQSARKRFICDKWAEFEGGDDEGVWSAIVSDIFVALGIPAWSHEVCGSRLVANKGKIIVAIDNSWGTDWGTNGRGLLTGSYSRFDDACAPITFGASSK